MLIKVKRKKRVHKRMRNSADYQIYLKSKHWIRRRRLYWNKHKRICFCCSKYANNLHHKTYIRLYKEKDTDFVPLCRECHKEVHKLVRSLKATLATAHKAYRILLRKRQT